MSAQVLGAEEAPPEPQPFEESAAPAPDTWDAAEHEDDEPDAAARLRGPRARLFDRLCAHFRPSVAHPRPDLADLVHLWALATAAGRRPFSEEVSPAPSWNLVRFFTVYLELTHWSL